MLYVVSGVVVYLLLTGVHSLFVNGFHGKINALLRFIGAAIGCYALLSGMV